MVSIIDQNLDFRRIESNLEELERYFMAITFTPDDIYWICTSSRREPEEKIILGAFLNLSSEEINKYHKENFKLVGENLRKFQEQKKVSINYVDKKKYPIFSLIERLTTANKDLEKRIYDDICRKSGANSNEILIGVLAASVGCDEINFCSLVKEKSHWLHDCLNKTIYIDFQTTLEHFRGFGIGLKLITKGFEYYRVYSKVKGFVRASTMVSNPIIERFHDRLGSYRVATIQNYYPDGTTGILYCHQLKKESRME